MTRKRGWSVRALLGACILGLGLVWTGGASALSNGDPCSPFWTEATPPTAAFTISPASVSTLQLVQFDGSASQPGTAEKWTFVSAASECDSTSTVPDPIASYTWSFGDGSSGITETAQHPTVGHAYARPGIYDVTLVVTELNCQAGPAAHCFTKQSVQPITVQNRAPTSSFSGPGSVTTGRLASFDATNSTDPDGAITGYHWDFGDGQTQDTSGPTTSHTYGRSGPRTVTLTVTDDSGAAASSQQTVSVIDRPPAASFTAPASVSKGQAATFDASASSDPDGTITGYRWDFGDGQTQTTMVPTVSHAYDQHGSTTVMLTVTDDSGSTDHTQRTVTVIPGVPSASFTAPATATVAHPTTFDASASSDPDGTITGYRWDFGDGRTVTTSAPTTSHTYRTSGTLTVMLTITDDNGGAAAVRHDINVLPRACVVPRLLGKKPGQARRVLLSGGCRLGAIKHRRVAGQGRGLVIRQSVKPGAIRPAGMRVAVTVGK